MPEPEESAGMSVTSVAEHLMVFPTTLIQKHDINEDRRVERIQLSESLHWCVFGSG